MEWRTIMLLPLVGVLNSTAIAATINITGAGATFPAPIYSLWTQKYAKTHEVQINYQPIGSGGGIKQIIAKTVNFGASDKPLLQEELNNHTLMQFPTVLGAVVPVVHLTAVQPNSLKLTGQVLADIFQGKIKNWSDPSIAALNPGVTLPNKNITIIHRSDSSGTTLLFSSYLSKASADWAKNIGADVTVKWPAGVGGKGNEGVSLYIKQIEGAIGYVENSYATTNKLSYVQLKNKDGAFVDPTVTAVKAAAQSANWNDASQLLIDMPGQVTWPICGTTYILIHTTPSKDNAFKTKTILDFFDWAYTNGQEDALSLQYVPLPSEVIEKIKQQWKSQIKDTAGDTVWGQ